MKPGAFSSGRRDTVASLVLGSVLLLASCGDDQNAANNGDAGVRENNGCTGANCGPPDMGGADVADAAGEVDTAAPDLAVDVGNDMTVGTCGRVPAPADAARKVVAAAS